ncbi:hypothetical protein IOR63_004374 [Salmonella enterica subsp. enterica serovar Kentucky]|uniref:Uncharacterized protein n=1 Tax=Salmonella phage FSL SP-126 TaxID=2928681 RepID=S4TN09_9CAUD|nr:hypothetical protein FDI94_gp54 [Salmonella phage FSL SP-126]AGF87884.1 hypothetical protein SP126_00270 [Salmonella phage FSL SP-126]EGK3006508.1 hypothetical protein [Salmonella enterica subsp. enterica serovar Kentucky]EJT0791019.1 hypothetical protein [Salmonella enterica subsp. enterica serovar Kentucky]EME1300615.1 hypothetical protein [Salmonella enterica subsp. enterica serovar Kentucky]
MSMITELTKQIADTVNSKKDALLKKAVCAYFEIDDPMDAVGRIYRIANTEQYIDAENGEIIIAFNGIKMTDDCKSVELDVHFHHKVLIAFAK